MSWFGKLLGGTIGLMMGGPLGAIAGGALGHHLFDKEASGARPMGGPFGGQTQIDQRRAAYFVTLFSLLGKLAKVDGQVTREEGDLILSFLDRMHVHGEPRAFAIRVFNEAKDSPHSAEELARQFAYFTEGQPHLRSTMLDMLYQIALADGRFHPSEEEMIRRIAAILGVSESEMDALHSRYVGVSDKAYAVLGLSPEADDETVKKTYRKLVHEYHPDRIVSKGMPQEFVDYATEHFQKIQRAWDQIRKDRNL